MNFRQVNCSISRIHKSILLWFLEPITVDGKVVTYILGINRSFI